ncbi:hypothetical protein NC868_30440, partial [Pseudomonas aeruginosa]|nr:hypothetical protein [Pseudomonas aeruginosa]
MRLALRPLRRLSLAALATLGACSILPEAQVLQVYLLPVHNPPASTRLVRGLSSDDSNLQADFELGGDLRAFQT